MEYTLIIIKPDAMERRLAGEIIGRFERRGFEIVAIKRLKQTLQTVREHYAEHAGKPFFDDLCNFLCGGPVIAFIIYGENAVTISRTLIGATSITGRELGSIRGDYSNSTMLNLVHGSDSKDAARREIGIWFPEFGCVETI